MGNKGKMYKQR